MFFNLPKLPSRVTGWPKLDTRLIWACCMLKQQREVIEEQIELLPRARNRANIIERLRLKREIKKIEDLSSRLENLRKILVVKNVC